MVNLRYASYYNRPIDQTIVTPPKVVSRAMQLPNVHDILSEQRGPSVPLLLERHFAMPSHLNSSSTLL